jgi:hypothetical protein
MTRNVADGGAKQRYPHVTKSLILASLVVICLDGVVRIAEARLSGDVASKRGFAQVMQEAQAGKQRPLVAVVGSSLVGRGVDSNVLSASLEASQGTPVVAKLAPDNSTIWDWTCVAEKYLLLNQPAVKTVIIGFAWDQLSDRAPLILRRNFNHLCEPAKLRDFSNFSSEIRLETWLDMAAVTASKLYTHREPIRDLVFSRIIPNYQSVSQQINESNNARVVEPVGSTEVAAPSNMYRAAQSLIQRLGARGTRVVLVAMPVRESYEIDRSVCDILGREHEFLDLRTSVPADPRLYRDAIHLNEAGAVRFSVVLASQLNGGADRSSPCAN